MNRLKWIIILFVLCGCQRQRSIACEKQAGDILTYIDIEAINDDITLIKVKEIFIIEYDLLVNDKIKTFLDKQIDESYYYLDNKLIREYTLFLDNKYSLNKTLEELKKEKYLCG